MAPWQLSGALFVAGGVVPSLALHLLREPHAEDAYDTFFVEAVSALADSRVFSQGRWSLRSDNAELHTLHHLGAGLFGVPSSLVQGQTLPGASG